MCSMQSRLHQKPAIARAFSMGVVWLEDGPLSCRRSLQQDEVRLAKLSLPEPGQLDIFEQRFAVERDVKITMIFDQ